MQHSPHFVYSKLLLQVSPDIYVYVIRWRRMVYGLYTSGQFDRARGRSPSGLSKLKPRVCNPVDHKKSHRIKYLYDDFRRMSHSLTLTNRYGICTCEIIQRDRSWRVNAGYRHASSSGSCISCLAIASKPR